MSAFALPFVPGALAHDPPNQDDRDEFLSCASDHELGPQTMGTPPEEEDEELDDISHTDKENDPLFKTKIKNQIEGIEYSGEVEDIVQGKKTKEKLYQIRYHDGDVEHLTQRQVELILVPSEDDRDQTPLTEIIEEIVETIRALLATEKQAQLSTRRLLPILYDDYGEDLVHAALTSARVDQEFYLSADLNWIGWRKEQKRKTSLSYSPRKPKGTRLENRRSTTDPQLQRPSNKKRQLWIEPPV